MNSRQNQRRACRPLLAAAGCTLLAIGAMAHAKSGSVPAERVNAVGSDDAAPASSSTVRRSLVDLALPRLKMVRQDGVEVSLDKELNDGRPVVLSFVYTSCATICPIVSQEFSLLQERLGKNRERVHLVLISIDPEQDTPQRLRDYARQFRAGKDWDYYTGDPAASIKAQIAFGVYRGDKMSHIPVTLLRTAPGNQWVRLDGFASATLIHAELHGTLARR